jgi:hypothetical protein
MRRAALICAIALAFPAAAAADTSFPGAGLGQPQLTVRGDLFVWTYDQGSSMRLRQGFGSGAADVPVPAAHDFRGVDLGTDERGHVVLVYGRCPHAFTRCDIYSYSFGSGRERRLGSVSKRRCNEVLPRIDRGALAFVRGRARGCRAGLFVKLPGHRERRVMRNASYRWDFQGRTIAFEVYRPGRTTNPEENSPVTSEIRRLRIGHRHSVLVVRARGSMSRGGSRGQFVSAPLLDGRYGYWIRAVFEPTGVQGRRDILRRRIGGGAAQALSRSGRLYVGADGDTLDSFAVQGERLFYSYSTAPQDSIGRVEPLPAFS